MDQNERESTVSHKFITESFEIFKRSEYGGAIWNFNINLILKLKLLYFYPKIQFI